ncbi:MAG: right-handed parallel beta-helix repeat-containing protein [Planctomycetota bacterium]
MNTTHAARATSAIAIAAASAAAQLGPITPPAGPVADTGPDLGQLQQEIEAVEPRVAINATNTPGDADSFFRISRPGSYYLTGKISASAAGFNIIEVAAGDVTIDLNGNQILGFQSETAVFAAAADSVVVKNGTIRLIQGRAISLGGENCVVSDVRAYTTGGITVGDNGVVRRTAVNVSSSTVIVAGRDVMLRDCSIRSTVGAGVVLGETAIARDCTVRGATGSGFLLGLGAQAVGCIAANNSGPGFQAFTDNLIDGCTSRDNGSGALAGSGVTIRRSLFVANNSHGINIDAGGQVHSNVVRSNGSDGIIARASNLVADNTCDANGQHGIVLLGQANRVERNNLTANQGTGLRATAAAATDNAIVRNSARANGTNYSVIGNNFALVVVGPTQFADANIDQ